MRTTSILCLMIALTGRLAYSGEPVVPEIARLQRFEAARASSTDPTGGNRDHLTIEPGQTVQIADLTGPGIIRHCWFTLATGSPDYLSRVTLRMRWDDDAEPAVDSPWGPFFGLGHDEVADMVSEPIVVMAGKAPYIKYPPGYAAFHTYFPMPFRKRARITVTNGTDEPIRQFFFHIDWQKLQALPDDTCRFHARYRTEHTKPETLPDGRNVSGEDNYVILETAGRGHYVGCTLHVEARPDEPGKWYEGDEMIAVDGAELDERILGTGSEDYFGMAWGVRRHFQSPCFGTSYFRWPEQGPEMQQYGTFSLYRFHLRDPIPFSKSIHVSIEHGYNNDAGHRYASVAYWYAHRP